MFSRLAFIASMTLTLAACEGTGLPGSGSQQEPAAQGHKGPPDVSPLEAPIEPEQCTGTSPRMATATESQARSMAAAVG